MRILVLGIGNVLFGDEGIGVHLANVLKNHCQFAPHCHELDILDGGTLAQALIPRMVQADHLVILDTLAADDSQPGDVFFFNFEQCPPNINWQGSAHEVEMLQTLVMMDLAGDRPETWICGVVPTRIDRTGFDLSDPVIRAAELMQQRVLQHLTELGVECSPQSDAPHIQTLANQSCQPFAMGMRHE